MAAIGHPHRDSGLTAAPMEQIFRRRSGSRASLTANGGQVSQVAAFRLAVALVFGPGRGDGVHG